MEEFETGIPSDWNVQNIAGPGVSWQLSDPENPNQPAYAGEHAAYLAPEAATLGTTTEDWLITPQFIMPENGQLHFFSRLLQEGNQGSTYKIMLNTAGTSFPGDYTEVQTWTETQINPSQLEYNEISVALPASSAGVPVSLAFVMLGNNGDGWLVDNVSVINGCPAPTSLTATVNFPDDTAATVHWDAGDGAQWEVYALPADEFFTGVTAGTLTSDNTYILTNLDYGSYKVYVRTLCADGGFSEWAGPVVFSTAPNTITGTVRYDANGDEICNGNDAVVTSTEVQVTLNGNTPYSVYTNAEGHYHLENIPMGSNTVTLQVVPPAGFPEIDPVTQTFEFSENVNTGTMDLCLPQPDEAINDISVSLIPDGNARPGFASYYKLVVINHGTTIINGINATLTFDDERLDFLSATGNYTEDANNITFDIGSVQPFATEIYNVAFSVLQPPVNEAGDELEFSVALTQNETDATPEDNIAVLNQIIVNAVDPNDIIVHEGAYINEDQTADYLNYTIRFQNTGTADAVNIRLENVLDDNLDWDTFQPLTASHNYSVDRNGGQLKFYFNNIHLPDSTANEEGSHGFVSYRIKPRTSVTVGDIVYNTAGIFFDFNPAVITNTASTEVVANAGVKTNTARNIVIYPNPANDKVYITALQGDILSSELYDINGRLCLKGKEILSVSALKAGIYFVKVTTLSGTATFKIVKQ